MSKRKNEELMKSIMTQNFCSFSKSGIKSAMMHQEVAGQRVFYVFLKQHGYDINPEDMDKCQSDGIIGNCIIECKLNSDEGGGPKKAGQELYTIIPNRLKSKGLRVPYYRIYVELETFLVEVYKWDSYEMIESFDWYENPDGFRKYFEDKDNLYSYDLSEEAVDLVEVIQNIYEEMNISDKLEAYSILEKGIPGWFLPFDIKHANINKLILNNDKMNEKYVQKVQGAFFTPSQYVKISTEYVLKAIEESKKDGYDDYIIVDRCAGVGNLESQFPEEVYSHMILGTINQAEALTANIRFGEMTEVVVQDALSREGVLLYKEKIDNYKKEHDVKKLAIIFLENPPYLRVGFDFASQKITTKKEKSYVQTLADRAITNLDDQFIWSCFEIYKPYAYIHYGPIHTWKDKELVNKEVKAAYLCNRKYFNATEAAIALFWWTNKNKEYEYIDFNTDIDKIRIKKVKTLANSILKEFYADSGVCIIKNMTHYGGYLNTSIYTSREDDTVNKFYHFDKGHWISKENLLKALPIWVVSFTNLNVNPYNKEVDYRYIDTFIESADMGIKYQEDNKFLQDCLLYTMCTHMHRINSEEFYKVCDELLDEEHKNTEIYRLYKELAESTGTNGLKNIEKYKLMERGHLFVEMTFGPEIDRLKNLLSIYNWENIRPKMLEYELLK